MLRKETDKLKLSIETSQEMVENKLEKTEDKPKSHKPQYDKELWQENELLHEKMRDLENRSRRNNLRVDGLKEIENETWEQLREFCSK